MSEFLKIYNNINEIVNRYKDGKQMFDKFKKYLVCVFDIQTPDRIAEKELIKTIKTSSLPNTDKIGLILNIDLLKKHLKNQCIAIQNAIPYLNNSVTKIEDVDYDWMLSFFDKVRLISNEDCQKIWGKILASECNNPGTISKRLISILADMGKEDAKDFMSVRKLCVHYIGTKNGEEWCPVMMPIRNDMGNNMKKNKNITNMEWENDFYEQKGITYESLQNLQALGLVTFSSGSMYTQIYFSPRPRGSIRVCYGEREYKIDSIKSENIHMGFLALTKAGMELCSVIVPNEYDYDFFDKYVVPCLEEQINAIK